MLVSYCTAQEMIYLQGRRMRAGWPISPAEAKLLARTRFSVVSWVICHVLPPFVPALYLESVRTGHATENIWLTFVIMWFWWRPPCATTFFPLVCWWHVAALPVPPACVCWCTLASLKPYWRAYVKLLLITSRMQRPCINIHRFFLIVYWNFLARSLPCCLSRTDVLTFPSVFTLRMCLFTCMSVHCAHKSVCIKYEEASRKIFTGEMFKLSSPSPAVHVDK